MIYKNFISIVMVTTLVIASIIAAGCTGQKPADVVVPTPTATATVTPTEIATQVTTAEPTAEPTAQITPATAGTPQEYTIRIDKYMLIPTGGKEINVGDTLKFRNFEASKTSRVLVNEDGIWDEQDIRYMKYVSYSFNETGVYTFYLKGRDANKWKVTVV
jgi:plastocyanin